MKTAFHAQSPIFTLMDLAEQSAKHHGMDAATLLIHLMGLISSLAGATVRSVRTDGRKETALLSMTIVSRDSGIPAWVSTEWKLAHDAGNSGINVFEKISRDKFQQARRRRFRRTLEYIDPTGTILEHMVAVAILGKPTVRRFGSLRNYAPPGPPQQELRTHSLTHMAAASNQVCRALARMDSKPGEGKHCENQLFWLPSKGFEALARKQGPSRIDRFGLLVQAEPSGEVQPDHRPAPLCAFALQMLDALSFDNPPACYRPPEEIAAMLDRHQTKLAEIAAKQSASHGCTGLPSDLAWRFATLLHATCHGRRHVDDNLSLAMGRLALSLAESAARSHGYTLNQCLPADEQGWIDGDDLRILRALDHSPATIRQIQRSLRGIRKAVIVHALDRAGRAGLAIQHPENRHSLAPPPTTTLSEILENQDW